MEDAYKQSIKVYDPGAATTLLLGGYDMVFCGMKEDGRMLFCFKTNDRALKVLNDYFDDKIMIKARDFYDHSQMLIGAAYGARVLG